MAGREEGASVGKTKYVLLNIYIYICFRVREARTLDLRITQKL